MSDDKDRKIADLERRLDVWKDVVKIEIAAKLQARATCIRLASWIVRNSDKPHPEAAKLVSEHNLEVLSWGEIINYGGEFPDAYPEDLRKLA